jgi:hypothetical protein
MRLLSYNRFILEQNDESENSNDSIFTDLKEDISEKIEKSLNSSDAKTKEDFISAYLSDQEKNQIEGLINDSDIYEFYLKFRNQIDEILSDTNFYDKKPSEVDSFSLYDYLIAGTKRAIKETISKLQKP